MVLFNSLFDMNSMMGLKFPSLEYMCPMIQMGYMTPMIQMEYMITKSLKVLSKIQLTLPMLELKM